MFQQQVDLPLVAHYSPYIDVSYRADLWAAFCSPAAISVLYLAPCWISSQARHPWAQA